MTCYAADWEEENKRSFPDFTAANLRHQLVQSMRAFLDAAPSLASYDICADIMDDDLIGQPLCTTYEAFIPWTPSQLPFRLLRR